MAKRLMCIILSVMLVVAMMPTGVVADDESNVVSMTYGEITSSYSTVYEAVADAPTNSTAVTITLLDDSDESSVFTSNYSDFILVDSGMDVTIDLNGHTLKTSVYGVESVGYFDMAVFGELTIKDSSESQTGVIYLTDSVFGINVENGTFTLESGTIIATRDSAYGMYVTGSSLININGGTFTSTGSGTGATIYSKDIGVVINISGGTVSGSYSYGIELSKGQLNMIGGTVTAETAICVSGSSSAYISGGTVEGTTYGIEYSGSTATLVVSGGSVSGGTSAVLGNVYSISGITVTGGTFSSDVTSYVDSENYTLTYSDGKYTVKSNTQTYTLTYDDNVDSEDITVPEAQNGTELTISSTVPTRTGYTFAGWNTASDGKGDSYAAGDSITITADTTLYAQWTAITSYVKAYDVNLGSSLAIGFYLPAENFDTTSGTYTVTLTQTYGSDYDKSGIEAGDTRPVTYTLNNESTTYYDGVECYFLVLDGINAKELTDAISIEIQKDGVTIYAPSGTTSIAKFEKSYINKNSSDEDAVELAKALLTYGAAAQTYFNYNISDLATNYIPQ